MHSVEEVLGIIGQQVPAGPLGFRRVPADQCHGQILSEPVVAALDSPPFDRAILDGFAVRSADAVAGADLRVIGRQEAGKAVFTGLVGVGQCVAINTGGVLPAGADGVLMVEHSAPAGRAAAGGELVRVMKAVPPGYGIQRRGSDAKAGEPVLPAGTRLSAAAVGAAIAAGAVEVTVRKAVRVAVLTTGDELVPLGATPSGGQIRNSNHPMLCGLVRETLGVQGELLDLGTCGDVEEQLRKRLEQGLEGADVMVVTGGMSMGSKDLVPPVLKSLGVEFHVEKVRMKPGKPFVFGTRGAGPERRYVAGLPGNPVSAFVTFQVFVAEILSRLRGEHGAGRWRPAQAQAPFPANGEREFFQPCQLTQCAGKLLAAPLGWRGSGDVFTLAKARGLAWRAAGAAEAKAGDTVEVLRL